MDARLPIPGGPCPRSPLLAGAPIRLLLTSATVLFVELLVIRWIPANVKYVGFFSNFLLMASFLGIGVGILLGRRAPRLVLSPFAPLLLVTVFLVYGAQLNIQARDAGEILFGLDASTSADVNFVVLPLVVVLTTALMASVAMPLGPLLRSMPPLRAYAIDIGGSMVGILGFTVLAYLGTGPTAWFVVDRPARAVARAGRRADAMVVARRDGDARRHRRSSALVGGEQGRLVAVLPDLGLPGRRDPASTDPADGEPPVYLLVDGIPHQAILIRSKPRRASSTTRAMPGSRTVSSSAC